MIVIVYAIHCMAVVNTSVLVWIVNNNLLCSENIQDSSSSCSTCSDSKSSIGQ